ncbi:MAG: hypothetical protein ACKV22_37185 [Bryobacteraceae bacterium]
MKMSSAPLTLFCLMAALPAYPQSLQEQLDKAPPEVEHRLRERINGFYQAHLDRKFRQAEKFIAEDTKDLFYERRKPQIEKFEIREIHYSDKFTKAKATILCEQVIMLPGFAGKAVPVPIASQWKIENGDWYFFVDQKELSQTPFGEMKSGARSGGGGDLPPMTGPDVSALQTMVKAERDRIELSPGQESQQVRITNIMPGKVDLRLEYPPVPGLSAALESTEISARGSTMLSVSTDPKNPMRQSAIVRVHVQQAGVVLHFLVSYKGAGR